MIAYLALLLVAGPLQAQTGPGGGLCVGAIRANGAMVRTKGSLSVGQCFGPGQEVISPPGSVVTLITALGDTITLSGRLSIKEQGAKGQGFWVRNGTAAFSVAKKQLSFFNVEGQNGNRTFQAAVRGTTFTMDVTENKSVTLTPAEGDIRVTRAVKLDIAAAERAGGKRDVAAAKRAEGAGPADRAAQALRPDRSDILEGSYARSSEVVSTGSRAITYGLASDEVLSFATVSDCVESYRNEIGQLGPGGAQDLSDAYLNLGDCYLEGDDAANAAANYSKALAIDLRLYPDGIHADIAEDYRSLAEAHAISKPSQAVLELRKALDIDTAWYGDDLDPDIADDYRTLAALQLLLDRPGQAIAELEKALDIDQRLYPDGMDFDLAEDHRLLGESHLLAAIAANGSGDHLGVAVSHFEQALAIDTELYGGDDDPDLAADHRGLGYAHLLGGAQAEAFAAFGESYAIGLRLLDLEPGDGPADVDLADLDLASEEVDVDDLVNLYDDATMLADTAPDESHAEAFTGLADRIAAKLGED